MDIMSVIRLFGGLAIFIYGMTLMGDGLERAAGSNLEKTLEKVAGNIWKSLFMGIAVTMILQSSSATTVMVIGFVNAGIMNLSQSVGIILGANIGTTITAQIIRLDSGSSFSSSFFMQILKPSNLAYVAVLVGVILLISAKTNKSKDIGSIFIGFGILFIGMSTMEAAVSPLRDIPEFQQLFTIFTNPILGVLVGALVTAVIQSSSASVGILQALSSTGMITYASAIPIILGQNIGTCITAILSSLNANKNAKRAACVHFYFNFIGTFVFLVGVYAYQYAVGFNFWLDNIDKAGIANFHTVFNIVTVALFIPFNKWLVKIAEKTFPYEEVAESPLARLDERFLSSPELALEQCGYCINEMAAVALTNFELASRSVYNEKTPNEKAFKENEKFLDTAEVEISKYLLSITGLGLGASKKRHMEMLRTLSHFEKIGDYCDNIFCIIRAMKEENLQFKEQALTELKIMISAVFEILEMTKAVYATQDLESAKTVEPLEDVVDILKETLKTNHLNRLNEGDCTIQAGHFYLDFVYNLEKIADHCSNIAIYIIQQQNGLEGFNTHSYIMKRDKKQESYKQTFATFEQKYLTNLI